MALDPTNWRQTLSPYEESDRRAAGVQVATSFGPFLALWAAMAIGLGASQPWILLLTVPAAGFLVRIFIIQHDCGHRSFFASERANVILGTVCGALTLTPFHHWSRHHNYHHVHSGSLDHRGLHYITAWTVEEYQQASRWERLGYRIYRNPVFMFVIVAPLYFVVINRYPYACRGMTARDRRSVHLCNFLVLLLVALGMGALGALTFFLIAVPVVYMASVAGFFLFYVQHQFEHTYYTDDANWSYERAALEGSSYLALPRVLQWFTGNIGLHHIHHLSPRIPNYRLQACQDSVAAFDSVPRMTLLAALGTVRLGLWDEVRSRMVTFGQLAAVARPPGGKPPGGVPGSLSHLPRSGGSAV